MIHYLDTSFIVALLTPEANSDAADAWVARGEGALAVSPWVVTEVSSALSIKLRTGTLTPALRAAAHARWHDMLRGSVTMLAITDARFREAASFADRHDLNLRAGDALHLAIAADAGCTLVTLDTLDTVMAAAAPHVGVPVAAL